MISALFQAGKGRGSGHLYLARIGVSAVCGPLAFAYNAIMVELYHYSAADLSLVRIFASILALGLPLVFGLWVDRGMGGRRLALVMLLGGLFWAVPWIPMNHLGWIAAIGLLGAYASLGDMAVARTIPAFFAIERYQSVNALMLMSGSLAAAAGAAIAGPVISRFGFDQFAAGGLAVTMMAGLALLLVPGVPRTQTDNSKGRTGYWRGAMMALANRDIRLLLVHGAIAIITFTIVDMLLYLFLSKIVGLSLSAIALVISMRILTGALAPGLAMRRYGRLSFGKGLFLLSALSGSTWIVLGMTGEALTLLGAALLIVIPAVTSALFNVHAASFRQAVIPPELQAQTIAVTRALMFSAMPVAGLLVFEFSDRFSLSGLFMAAGGLQLSAAPLLLMLRHR